MYKHSPDDPHSGAVITAEYSHSPDYSKMTGYMCSIDPGEWLKVLASEQSSLFTSILVYIDGQGCGWVNIWKQKSPDNDKGLMIAFRKKHGGCGDGGSAAGG